MSTRVVPSLKQFNSPDRIKACKNLFKRIVPPEDDGSYSTDPNLMAIRATPLKSGGFSPSAILQRISRFMFLVPGIPEQDVESLFRLFVLYNREPWMECEDKSKINKVDCKRGGGSGERDANGGNKNNQKDDEEGNRPKETRNQEARGRGATGRDPSTEDGGGSGRYRGKGYFAEEDVKNDEAVFPWAFGPDSTSQDRILVTSTSRGLAV